MTKRIPFVVVGCLGIAFTAGVVVRRLFGFEYSAESILSWVQALGWEAPLIYVVLIIFRQFLFLPSALLLSVGGLCFGVLGATGLGTLGIFVSGVMKYMIARSVGRDSVERWFGERFHSFRAWLDRGGPVVVGLITAHPMGPMAWSHWGSGLSSIPLPAFAIAVAAGALLRSAAFAAVGSTLLAPGSRQFYLASTCMLAAIVVPLMHPAFRRRLFGVGSTIVSP